MLIRKRKTIFLLHEELSARISSLVLRFALGE